MSTEPARPVPEVEILTLDGEEDAVLTRSHLLRLHSRPGAFLVLDLRRSRLDDPGALLEDLGRTARGNGQELRVLGRTAPPPEPDARGLEAALGESIPGLAFRVSLPCRTEYLPELRRFFSARVSERFGEGCAFRFEVVMDELCLNAVEHSPSRDSRFEVECTTDGDTLHLVVSNEHPRQVDSSRIMTRRLREFDPSGTYMGERGRGLFLIARLVDGLNIRTGEGRVQVHVWKEMGGTQEGEKSGRPPCGPARGGAGEGR